MQYFKLHFCRKYCRPDIHLTFSIVNVEYLAEKPLMPVREPTVRMFFLYYHKLFIRARSICIACFKRQNLPHGAFLPGGRRCFLTFSFFPVFPRSHIQRLTEGFHKVAVGTKSAFLTDLSYRIAGTKQHSGGSLYPEIPEIAPGSHPDTALKTAGTLSFFRCWQPWQYFPQ